MSLDEYLASQGYTTFEGHTGQEPRETAILQQLAALGGVRNVLEIGFNAGHSSNLFLMTNPDCHVLSFDLGYHAYVRPAKTFIDRMYPARHVLVLATVRRLCWNIRAIRCTT